VRRAFLTRVRACARLLLAGELALGAGAQLLAQRPPQVAFDEPPLGPVYGRAADPDTGGDLLVGRCLKLVASCRRR